MKKLSLLGITALTLLTLAACSSGNDDKKSSESSSSSAPQTAQTTTETTQSSEQVTTFSESKNAAVAADLESQFNTDGEKAVDVITATDVVDDQSSTPHEVIRVQAVDGETRKNMIALGGANDAGTMTDDQKMTLYGIQQIVSDAAKNLNGENDSIMFTYLDDENNSMVLAYSTKTSDIIPLTEISVD